MKTFEKTCSEQEVESLMNEVRDELRRDALKKQIVSELQSEEPRRRVGIIMKHPAVLAILLVLTNICTAYVTASWQRNDWHDQQVRLTQLRVTEQKRAVADELAKCFAEINAVDDEVVDIYYNDANANSLIKEEIDRRTNWLQAVKNWEANSLRSKQKIALYFSNPNIQMLFEDVIARKARIHRHMSALPFDSNERHLSRWLDETFKKEDKGKDIFGTDDVVPTKINEAMEERRELMKDINQLVRLMKVEIRNEELGKQLAMGVND